MTCIFTPKLKYKKCRETRLKRIKYLCMLYVSRISKIIQSNFKSSTNTPWVSMVEELFWNEITTPYSKCIILKSNYTCLDHCEIPANNIPGKLNFGNYFKGFSSTSLRRNLILVLRKSYKVCQKNCKFDPLSLEISSFTILTFTVMYLTKDILRKYSGDKSSAEKLRLKYIRQNLPKFRRS